ncbi:pilus assembly protein CpaF [Bradyrhizobium japonicum]|uniref:CpaF family protein n=1 Tax=Bradyrhizobium elkanii TaxID=29448 RepID=UPI0003A9B40F|nr:CpaF family protein [Bradyrhizobium elkanii]MCP1730139.1 pilus assembly protein CpaF [Bradyrhizobium elkanii]MCS3574268.1 pilus assembly protein CpaF [Bradyrhizobium elkanii]MCS3593041.1 pilus assembly protein CpaF [Bradyrhizobium elkanii]MCS3622486.1 pilus assembly protein CpaF [Bradyrhizobium elkanii]MCW2109047.1 pilus assembly protein CpaF [Bradyrhizobium elkanii]
MKKFGRREDETRLAALLAALPPSPPGLPKEPPSLPTAPSLVTAAPTVAVAAPSSAAPAPASAAPAPKRAEPSHQHSVISASLRERVIEQIEPAAAVSVSRDVLRRQIEEIIHGIANQERLELSGREQLLLAEEIADDMTGYGPLRPLLLDETINDIMVNGPNNIYVERRGKLERIAVRFRDNDHIAAVGQKIAGQVGRRVDESSPMVDCRLPDGSRVNIIFPPLAIHSPCISIRKFPSHRLNIAGMIANGSMTAAMGQLLEIAARSRLNVLVSGGTGSGKTTLLNAMSQFIDHSERIVTIEDAAELQLQQPHVISLETRPPSIEGTGQVTQRDLLWNALRMRPDRIIVGEVRSVEAFDMLQAMNTGHDGSISTVHANSSRDALTRIENMVQMGQVNLPPRAIRAQIVAALDVIVQVERMRDGQRRIVQISEVIGLEGDVITTNDIASFQYQEEDVHGRIVGSYRSTHAIPKFKSRLVYYGLDGAWAEAMRQI